MSLTNWAHEFSKNSLDGETFEELIYNNLRIKKTKLRRNL